jgi:hypothetical protein
MRSLAAVATVAALVLAGCGETVLDSTNTEEQLTTTRERETGEKVSSVNCPSDIQIDPGKTFECTIVLKGGKEEIATLRIRNKNADLSMVSVTAAKKGG